MKGRGRLVAGVLCLAILFADAGPMGMRVMASEAGQENLAVNDDNSLSEEKKPEDESSTQMEEEVQGNPVGDESDMGEQGNLSGGEDGTVDKGELIEEGDDVDDKEKLFEGDGSVGKEEKTDESGNTRDESISENDALTSETSENLGDETEELQNDVIDSISENDFETEAGLRSNEKIWSGEIAVRYAKGNGTSNNPYQIANGAQLAKLGTESGSQAHYILTQDIYLNDVSNSDWTSAEKLNQWKAIENFNGTFDGLNHSIYGLYGDSLFGYTTGELKNINIKKSYIKSGYQKYVGAIAGYASYIYGCSNSGKVWVKADGGIPCVGGIAGRVGTIEKCCNSGTIGGFTDSTGSTTPWVGGIAGEAGIVDQCFNTGSVECHGGYEAAAGGIVGYSHSSVSNSYNTGSIAAYGYYYTRICGGIVGDCRYQGTTISYCYNIGALKGGSRYLGNIVGISATPGLPTLQNCSYKTGACLVGKGIDVYYGGYVEKSCNALTESDMKDANSHIGFDFDDIWCINGQYNEGYPMLQWYIMEEDIIPPMSQDIIFTDSSYSVYTNYDVCIMAKIANGSNLLENDFTWKSNDENVAKIISTNNGQLGDVTYAFATVRGTGNTLGYGSLTLTLSDGRSARCAIICVGKKTNEKQSFYQVPTQPKGGEELLNYYGKQWEEEYDNYIEEVKKCLKKYASSDEGEREAMIAAVANKMQEEDKKSSSKHLSFEASFPKDWSKSDVYKAYARYLGDHVSSKMNFNGSLNEKKMVKTVLNSLTSAQPKDYGYGNMAIVISEMQFSRAKFGTVTCYKKNNPNKTYMVAICSTEAECKKIIGDFFVQLEDLGYEAEFNIYSAVAKDILGQSASSFTEKWLKQHLNKYLDQLNQSGVGNLYNNLSVCNKYYSFIQKIRSGDMDAAGKLLEKMATLELDEQTAGDDFVKKAVGKLKKACKELNNAYTQYMAGELKEDWLQKTWRALFSCPVSISVWNENGDQLGYVGEDDIWYTDAISIEEEGEAKIINSWTNEKLTFTISGTDYGILGCSIEEYDIGNEPKGRVNFYDIPLSEDAVLTLDMPDTLPERMVMRASDGSEIASDEYIPVEDAGGVDITCVIEADTGTGGTVLGAGKYVRGDAAVLAAMPEAGFRFGGWYRDDILLTGARVYEFTAKEDVNLKAKFFHEIITYMVTFDTQGHGTVPVVDMEVEPESKIEEPPAPTAEGYTFTGWYKEKSCENKWDFAADIVQEDITLYAGWTENGAEEGKYYRVTFDTLNHGIAPEAYTEVKENSLIPEPDAPTADGYRFIGWFKDDKCTVRWQFDADTVTSDLTLYAGWIPDDGIGDVLPEDIPASGIIPSGLWIAAVGDYLYTGKPIKPEAHVYDSKTRLKKGQDYTITYKNNTKAGDASAPSNPPTIVVKGKGNYAGTETETFTIRCVSLNDSEIVCDSLTTAYTGKVQKLIPTISYGGKKLSKNKDFIISYPDLERNVTEAYCAPGTYDILLAAKDGGNYAGTRNVKLTITKNILLSKATVKKIPDQPYTGKAIEPELTVSLQKASLIKNTDYTVTYTNNQEAGKATVILKGIGDYAGTKKVTFNITGTSLKKAKISTISAQTYSGLEQKPNISLTVNGTLLKGGTDYQVTYANNLNAGTGTVTIKGINAYTGSIKKTFRINAYDLKEDTAKKVGGLQANITGKYLKGGSKPKVELTYAGKKLTEGTDYTLSYKNNKALTAAGTRKLPTIAITGKGNFKGNISKTFTIVSKTLNDKEFPVILRAADKGFADKPGNYISKPVLIDADGKKLVLGKDYDNNVIYMRENGQRLNKNDKLIIGEKVKVKVTGKGAYSGELEALYEIKPEDFSKAKIKILAKPYTGKEITLGRDDITVKLNGSELTFGTDYEIVDGSYNNNLKKGTAEVTIVGKGKYGGMKPVKFRIISRKFQWFWRFLQ